MTNKGHFADDIFALIFVYEKYCILIEIWLQYIPRGPITNKPAYGQIMAWRQKGDKPPSEPIWHSFDANMRHVSSILSTRNMIEIRYPSSINIYGYPDCLKIESNSTVHARTFVPWIANRPRHFPQQYGDEKLFINQACHVYDMFALQMIFWLI